MCWYFVLLVRRIALASSTRFIHMRLSRLNYHYIVVVITFMPTKIAWCRSANAKL
ncbi:hypothetical protein PHJA_002769600 [Phtheirospermum japonicum]|uniref:Uncharacterized protein n=1 Tax=Phtheirospermum japonicum TaxID=374723 RepID=A0A830D3M2_9LAMI|nr:hypothetical protein PHJA_002769600 [Phtheirospermum japonicum]